MRILVDADSCSVKNIIETVAEDKQVPVVLFSDYNHQLTSAYSEMSLFRKAAILLTMRFLVLVRKETSLSHKISDWLLSY